METTPGGSITQWLGLGLALGLVLLMLLCAALAGLLPWPVPLATWLLGNALLPLAMLRRRPTPAVARVLAGD